MLFKSLSGGKAASQQVVILYIDYDFVEGIG